MIRGCIRLVSEGKPLSADQIMECMKEIMRGEASSGQMGAFLVGLHFNRSFQYTPDVIFNSAEIMLSFAIGCPIKSPSGVVLDIVGTGGDTLDTFNASTAAAFVVASAGITVAKHGNRSSSGRCGSADLVEALGANILLEQSQLSDIIDKCGFGFLFAQKFHPAMKSVAPVRKDIGIRTIFNILGPLSNPAKPSHMLVGVGTEELGLLYAKVFQLQKKKRVMVVHSLDGLDEISTSTPTKVWLIEDGREDIQEMQISPIDFGLQFHPVEDILGSNPEANVATLKRVLEGEEGPIMDFLLLNAGAALFVAGVVSTLKEGASKAKELLISGKVKELVENYVKLTNDK